MIGFSAMATGSFTFSPLSVVPVEVLGATVNSFGASLIGGGIIAAIFMLGSIALQHGFNACLGPSEKQDRTLMLTAEVGFLSMLMVAIFSYAFLGLYALIINVIISVIGWYYTYAQYIALSKRDAAAWLDSKPIVELEGA
jgi:tetrahydromethanopterin S-methyltransferase subunit C